MTKKRNYNDELNNILINDEKNNQIINNDNLNNQMMNNDDLNNQMINNDLNNQMINDEINNKKQSKTSYEDIQKLLYKIYVTDKNYDGINELYRKAKLVNNDVKKSDVKMFLQSQKSYQQTFQPIKELTYAPIYSEIPYSFQMDLSFIPQYKEQNKGIYVLFTAININTRYAYASYAKNKDTDTILKLFQQFQNQVPEINYIMGDLGCEFTNKKFISYLDKCNISYHFFKSESHTVGLINRFHRTLKEKILKYMLANDTTVWYDVLDEIIKNYNNTYHRGIKMRPVDVNNFIEQIIIMNKRIDTESFNDTQTSFNIDDVVRVKIDKSGLGNKMEPIYGSDTYKIIKVNKNTIGCVDVDNNKHTFKKDNVIVVNQNDFVKTSDMIKESKKVNTIAQKIKRENLIDEPVATRLRTNRTKTKLYSDDYIT